MIYCNHSSLVILVNDERIFISTQLSNFFHPFYILSINHKINRILLISLQILVKSFVSNIIIDLSYNLNKYTRYKHVWKLFQVDLFTATNCNRLYRLDRNEKLSEILAYPSNNAKSLRLGIAWLQVKPGRKQIISSFEM